MTGPITPNPMPLNPQPDPLHPPINPLPDPLSPPMEPIGTPAQNLEPPIKPINIPSTPLNPANLKKDLEDISNYLSTSTNVDKDSLIGELSGHIKTLKNQPNLKAAVMNHLHDAVDNIKNGDMESAKSNITQAKNLL